MKLFINLMPPPKPANRANQLRKLVEAHKIGKYKYASLEQRFEAFIDYEGSYVTDEKKIAIWPELAGTRCYIFTGTVDMEGYGRIIDRSSKTSLVRAHRVAWKLEYGKYPELDVLHKCDVKICVNIDHLFLGTDLDNARDRAKKGNTTAGVSLRQLIEIRAKLAAGCTLTSLARRYGVSTTTIWCIKTNRTWKHVQ